MKTNKAKFYEGNSAGEGDKKWYKTHISNKQNFRENSYMNQNKTKLYEEDIVLLFFFNPWTNVSCVL